jgi:hypothetical protein
MSYLKELEKLEQEESKLKQKKIETLEKRKSEIADLIERAKLLNLDNDKIIGALIFARECTTSSELAAEYANLIKEFQLNADKFFRRKPTDENQQPNSPANKKLKTLETA